MAASGELADTRSKAISALWFGQLDPFRGLLMMKRPWAPTPTRTGLCWIPAGPAWVARTAWWWRWANSRAW